MEFTALESAACGRRNARAGMHCDSGNVVAYELAFTGMKAAP